MCYISMVWSTKVLCPQNFSRKLQRYKRRISNCVDIWHLCYWLLLTYLLVSK